MLIQAMHNGEKHRAMKKVMYVVFFSCWPQLNWIKWCVENSFPIVFSKVPREGVILHHNNASSRTTGTTVQHLVKNKIKIIDYSYYSPHLAMCGFWLFFERKKHLRGRKLQSEEEIDIVVVFFYSIRKDSGLNAFKLWK